MRRTITLFSLVFTLAIALPALAQDEPVAEPETQPAAELTGEEADEEIMIQAMFVQSAHSVAYADGKLTLERVGPSTLFFSDRPERVVGHMTNDEFVVLWNEEGENNFVVDPPNAVLSMFDDDEIVDVVVILENPTLGDDHTFTYDVTVIDGEMPETGDASTLFIDPVGMPATPTSAAGVHRRHRRRRTAAVVRH